MIAKTLYFGNPAYLSCQNQQMVVKNPTTEDKKTIPIEDIGIVILDHPQITITSFLMQQLLENTVALILCNQQHHPTGLFLPLEGHSKQGKIVRAQLNASEPLKKQLWQTIIKQKIINQAIVMAIQNPEDMTLFEMAKKVKTGDHENMEAQAAAYYWKKFNPWGKEMILNTPFKRDRDGDAPNNLLNYGYAILRAIVARNLVASGLMPVVGLFHKNQYNSYALADDIMEPYRPLIDQYIIKIVQQEGIIDVALPAIKKQMLSIPILDVKLEKLVRPLSIAVQYTTASLAKSFVTEKNCLQLPTFK